MTMNNSAALKIVPQTRQLHLQVVPDNIIEVEFKKLKPRRSTSLIKSDGQIKATAADPIRNQEDIHILQEYFLSKGNKTGYRNYAIFTLGIMFGIRGGDLLSLRVHHLFNRDGSFKTHCTIYEQKTRKTNNPAISARAQEIVGGLFDYYSYEYDDFLFRSNKKDKETGKYEAINLRQWNHILSEASKKCEISDHISSHSLRKTFAYHTIKLNPNDDEAKFALQKMLNHRDFKTTLTYCGITQESVDKMRSSVESGLGL